MHHFHNLTALVQREGHIVCHDSDRPVFDERQKMKADISDCFEFQQVDMEGGFLGWPSALYHQSIKVHCPS